MFKRSSVLAVLLLSTAALGSPSDESFAAQLLKLLFAKYETPVTRFETKAVLLDHALENRNVIQSVPIFADQWLFSDGRRIALANDGIYTRRNTQTEWRTVYRADNHDEAVSLKFDSQQRRGVATYGAATITTIDGGLNWTRMNTDPVVQNQFGTTDHWTSGVYLDPETGHGSFTANCTWFSTDDFGKSWSVTSLEFSDPEQQRKACLSIHPWALDADAGFALVRHLRKDYILARPEGSTNALNDWQPLCRTREWVWEVNVDFCGDVALNDAQRTFYDKINQGWRRTTPYLTADIINELMDGASLPQQLLGAMRDNGANRWIAGRGFLAIADKSGQFEFEYRIPALEAIYPLNDSQAVGVSWHRIYQSEDAGRIWRLISKPNKRAGILTQNHNNGSVLLYDGEDYRYWDGKESRTLGHLQDEIEDIDLWVPSQDNRHMWVLPWESHYYWISNDSGQNWHKHLLPFPPPRIDEDQQEEHPWPIALDCKAGDSSFDCATLYEDGHIIRWRTDTPKQFQLITTPDLVSNAQYFTGEHYSHGEIYLLGSDRLLAYLIDYETLYLHTDNQWTARSTSKSYTSAEQTDGGDARLLIDGNEILRLDDTGEQNYYRFADMQHIYRHCSNNFGVIVLIDEHRRLALTLDGGSSWLATTHYDPSSELSCGLYKRWLWILEDRMIVAGTNVR